MEYEPAEYQKLQIRTYAPRSIRETAEGKYWRRFKSPIIAKQFGAVSHIDFCQQYPFNLAVTASTRVILYNGLAPAVIGRTISRFKDIAYSGCFRSDGRLVVAGGQDGIVQVFDANSRSVLRQFKAHKRPTRVARFGADKLHILSGSDDVTARWWDLTSGSQVLRLDGHRDYVRAAAASPTSPDMWATGGYDHCVKLWDIRTGNTAVLGLDHGAPVEDVAFFPSGSLAVTAGGNYLCVWDLLGGGRLIKRLENFQKTVTCVRLSPLAGPDSAAAPRMLAGSLDGHVKIFELDSFRVTHATKYPAPVLSMGLSPDCRLLAVGLADGTLSVRRHARPRTAAPVAQERQPTQPKLTAANYRYFIRGQNSRAAATDFRVRKQRQARLQPYDKMLRQFRYRDALDSALSTRQPEVVASLLEELAARGGLGAALGGRDAEGLRPVLRHLVKYMAEPRYTRLLSNVGHRLLDTYAEVVGVAPAVDRLLGALRDRLAEELGVLAELTQLAGALEPLLAASLAAGGLGEGG
ncbi:hypothetical protein VOLCADRAFT_66565 [Volvox carteri f. nagariensis]|uniref:U3 small nucleolar RNA-associated protein 15 C-terminal domain-containing protein n=1 Tax=Volvox carteri f. nagariensis TaxID=3068 RepID=D8UBR8_VOLCA|nr:uncharacterized protein VOLCADRAFT_66565 [Volvox carteri f. nagariensis]EFJ42814.1 hypothetical protein VOLCADRAFT_66565 [Volvox carteri f. nagariensis]|eukprot:XP_002956074.1 hypothetical protein VOLCADRAFT_66565 [Volvox carteri f. nagariensis]